MNKSLNILNWLGSILILIGYIQVLFKAIKIIFIDKNYKHKFTTWVLFAIAIIAFITYILFLVAKNNTAWGALCIGCAFLISINQDDNIKRLTSPHA